MRCADFHVFSLRVQGPQPLPREVRNPGGFRIYCFPILVSCRCRARPLPTA